MHEHERVYQAFIKQQSIDEARRKAERKAKAIEEENTRERWRIQKYKAVEANYPRHEEQNIIKRVQQSRPFRYRLCNVDVIYAAT